MTSEIILVCEKCGETENVARFPLFGEGEPGGEEMLCWEHRFPYIKKRVDCEIEVQANSKEPEPESPSGQMGLFDY